MSITQLSDEQRDTIRQAVIAVRDGGYVPRDDISARIGVSLDAMNAFVSAWPEVDDRDDESDTTLIINNSLNEICHGVEVPKRDWSRWFSVPLEAVKQTYRLRLCELSRKALGDAGGEHVDVRCVECGRVMRFPVLTKTAQACCPDGHIVQAEPIGKILQAWPVESRNRRRQRNSRYLRY